MTDFKVGIDPTAVLLEEVNTLKEVLARERAEVQSLTVALKYEQAQRRERDQRIAKLEEELYGEVRTKRKRRTKAEMEEFRRSQNDGEYSELKSNGIKKASKTEPIHSYSDYRKIEDYLRSQSLRNAMLWRMGVCFGVRASDLTLIKWSNIFDEKYVFRDKVKMYELKTNKLQSCLITEAVREIVLEYLDSVSWNISHDEYVFSSARSRKAGSHLTEIQVYRIINDAAKAVGIEYNVGSHTMRRSFANIVLCVDKSVIDMNAIAKIQGLLNHSDSRITMKYLGTLDKMYDRSREIVSDFVLGKTDVDELVAGNGVSMEDVMNKLDRLIENQK